MPLAGEILPRREWRRAHGSRTCQTRSSPPLSSDQPSEELFELAPIRGGDRCEELGFGPIHGIVGAAEHAAARRRRLKRVRAAVLEVALSLDEPSPLELVDDGDHGRPVNPQSLSESLLGQWSLGGKHGEGAELLHAEPERRKRCLSERAVGEVRLAQQIPQPA